MLQKQKLRKISVRAGIACIALAAALWCSAGWCAAQLPSHYYLEADRPLHISAALPVTVSSASATIPSVQEAQVKLFGVLPVKTVSLTTMEPAEVMVGGEPFGIRMLMAGAMVVSLGDVTTLGGMRCPAAEAGIAVGDVIQAVDGEQISGNADLQAAVSESGGQAVSVTFLRDGLRQTVSVTPAFSSVHGCYQTGMWVRDSTAGIGTVTYYLPAENGNLRFAGLGHPVCDPDTGEQIPLASGEVLRAVVTDVLAGSAGRAGELRGRYDTKTAMGTLLSNTASGVFGILHEQPHSARPTMPLGYQQDVRLGEAEIYTTVTGDIPSAYTVEIEEIHGNAAGMRNLVVHITDADLLAKSGGIVQGMSGSPIVQNGRLVGAVTHVFVRDPTRGYGILAENMYAQTVAEMSAE